ncbi:Crp/Fnr family transcriptional regulator [Dactylosporangium vinaceum]|uniref:Crp/Fnr family transcriptional regulator n=1 Tax=Dactylosporangium vinaceum TaxID=53362 RepID=A0ABV5MJ04_9ACTN|nr:Crp/Fnr family transcriptional regulator [Dactylosporangium vinaceum]UAB93706.1 Crp/Fnr family transcriptional regulator [Dactylosporangium vinaceum]
MEPLPDPTYWDDLTTGAQAALLAAGEIVRIAPRRPVLTPATEPGEVFIIRQGLVKIVARAGSKQVVLALRGPGDILGESACLDRRPGSSSALAIGWVEVHRVTREPFADILDRHPVVRDQMVKTATARARESGRDRVAAATMNVAQRLARVLLKIALRYGLPSDDGGVTIPRLPVPDLAAYVGGGTSSVARVIKNWRDRSILATNPYSMTVHRPDDLHRIVGADAPPS